MTRDFVEFFREQYVGHSTALSLCYAGKECCQPGHSFGPATRPHYLLHFILNGNGIFKTNNTIYSLQKNQAFLIKPGELSYYQASLDHPWEYIWIAIMGNDVTSILQKCGLMNLSPIINYKPDTQLINALNDIIHQLQEKKENEYFLLSDLYTIFGILKSNYSSTMQSSDNLYLKQAVNFIHNHYEHNLRVQDLSNYLQIDRTYLYRLFMEEFQMSPKQYLLKYQLNAALQLLTNTTLQIKEISYSCGFPDPARFSKYFKAEYGFRPNQLRKIDGNKVLSFSSSKELNNEPIN